MTETTTIAGRVYRVSDLRSIADQLPTVHVEVKQLKPAAGPGHTYWVDRAGKRIGPHDLFKDWEAAQRNPDWADHVATIKHANLTDPIWVYEDGSIIDGVHRLARAIWEKVAMIPAKLITEKHVHFVSGHGDLRSNPT